MIYCFLLFEMRRVVITGCGALTPCGDSVKVAWNSIIDGKCWIEENTKFDVSAYKSKICSSVKIDDNIINKYIDLVSLKDKRHLDDIEYAAIIASYNAMVDCNLINDSKINRDKFGTFIASGIGGIKTIQDTIKTLFDKGCRRVSPFFLTASLANMCAGNVALKFGLKGANMTHVSACASSTHAIGEAFNYIRSGRLDGCLAGGTEIAVCEITVAGFDAMNALSTKYNNTPRKASRTLDKDRDGFVIGEGSVVLMLEELEHAISRKAKIYAEVVGYGASCDAYHITSPNPNGLGASMAMNNAIEDAGIKISDIDYINLHGTSTPLGDVAEISAIKNTFKKYANDISISSTKSATGHLLGVTGALEAMFCIKAIEEQIVPPSINIENLDDCCEGMKIVQKATKEKINYTLSNSFGFGGTNGCLIFKKFDK